MINISPKSAFNSLKYKREDALLMRQSPRWLQVFGTLMLLLGVGVIGAGYVIRLDEVVSASGVLKAKAGREDVKSPAGGKVAEVLVSNGNRVAKGDLLIRFDTTQAKDQKARSTELIGLERESLMRAKRSSALQRATLEQRLKTQKDIAESYASLQTFGGMSRLQTLGAQDQVLNSPIKSLKLMSRCKDKRLKPRNEFVHLNLNLKKPNNNCFIRTC